MEPGRGHSRDQKAKRSSLWGGALCWRLGGSWVRDDRRSAQTRSRDVESRSHQVPARVQEAAPRRAQELPGVQRSHGVIEHNILLGELQQHRIIEELADAHVLTQALPATGFDHELSGQVRSWLWLQGADDNALVQRITGYDLPMVEDRQGKGLPLRVSPQISLEAKRVDGRDESFDGVERGARDGSILSHMSPAPGQDGVDGRDTVCRGLDLYKVVGLHQTRSGHEEGRIDDSPGCGDDLAPAPMQGLLGNHCIQDLKLDISNQLVTEGPLPSSPLETLNDAVLHRAEKSLVHLRGQGVIHQDVGASGIRAKSPDGTGSQQIPVVLGLEELAQLLPVPCDLHHLVLYVLGQALLKGLSNHGDLVLLIGSFSKALEGGRFHYCLTKRDHGVSHLDVYLRVHLPQVVHHTIQVELPSTQNHVLARLFHLGGERRVALVDLAQAVQHLGQFGGVDRFHSDLDNRGGVELQGPENLSLLIASGLSYGRCLHNWLVNTFDQNPVASRNAVHFNVVPGAASNKQQWNLGRVLSP
uniref:116 kDa U5 small nuclear ribonucleoprotein component n=1 Tax=Sus scrofa TaxID=9823 RepID=A0A480F5T5_PIG